MAFISVNRRGWATFPVDLPPGSCVPDLEDTLRLAYRTWKR